MRVPGLRGARVDGRHRTVEWCCRLVVGAGGNVVVVVAVTKQKGEKTIETLGDEELDIRKKVFNVSNRTHRFIPLRELKYKYYSIRMERKAENQI